MTFARVARDTTLSVTSDMSPLVMTLPENKLFETSRAGKFTVPVKIERHNEFKGNPRLEARGMPPEIKVAPVTLDAQANEANVEIAIDSKAPLGEYSLFFVVQSKINYQRNPEAAKCAEENKKMFVEQVAQLAEAAKVADVAKVEAEKKVTELAASADKPETAEARKAAEEEKVKAIATAKVTADKLLAARAEQQEVDKRVSALTEAAKPKEIDAFVASPALTICIAESPLKMTFVLPPAPIKAGQQGEITVNFERLFGFAGPVDVDVELPSGVAGLSIDKIQIAQDESDGKLIVKTDANTSSGNHQVKLHLRMNFNGHALEVDRTAEVKIEEANATAK